MTVFKIENTIPSVKNFYPIFLQYTYSDTNITFNNGFFATNISIAKCNIFVNKCVMRKKWVDGVMKKILIRKIDTITQ